jgi:molybdopterin molybdotransferase
MLAVADAQKLILANTQPLTPQVVRLGESALGLLLAEDVVSDLDMPPFDKAMMDGYAVRTADMTAGKTVLSVVEEILAGQTPQTALTAGRASRIMTGAPIPPGADAVVPVEQTKLLEDGRVTIEGPVPRRGQNVLPRGREMRSDETVLRSGSLLRPQEIGLLGTLGHALVPVIPRPSVAILPTGDELVEAGSTPQPGQIRNSNGPMLMAQTGRAGATPKYLGIARDDLDDLRSRIDQGLQADALILSGGASVGKRDLVPDALREAGVVAHFHKVAMKPGKPLFFGTRSTTLVFGLPGNPVSSFVGFELFVRPALRRLQGHPDRGPKTIEAILLEDYPYSTDRPTYHPAHLVLTAKGFQVRVVPWFGSPDLRGLLAANAAVLLPQGDLIHRAGSAYSVLAFEDAE